MESDEGRKAQDFPSNVLSNLLRWLWPLPELPLPSPRRPAQPIDLSPSPESLLFDLRPLQAPPDRQAQADQEQQWDPDQEKVQSAHTLPPHNGFVPHLSLQKFLHVNGRGREGKGGKYTRRHKFQKATQVWPGLWWQSPLSTLTREAGLPGPGRCQGGPRSTGCRCCRSPGSPRPLHWAPYQGIFQASRPGAQSYGSAGRPAPKKAGVHA